MSSEDEVEGEGVMEGRKAGNEQLSMMCWNVCGWLRKNGGQYEQLYEEYDMRSAVIGFYSPDVVAVVESWLKGEDELVVEGYKWLGNNRRNLHKNAVRGSGGVGILVREEVLKHCSVGILDSSVEDVLWVQFSWGKEEQALVLAVCYIPPESSSRGKGAEETLQALAEGVAKYGPIGPLVICGDFNARLGEMEEEIDGIPRRKIIDRVKNCQGEGFVDFLRSTEMCVVNGRKGRDAFTCVSGRGGSVVDYCVVEAEELDMIENFRITTMSEAVEEMRLAGMAMRVPDHSLLQWDIVLENLGGGCERDEKQMETPRSKTRLIVPENYLEDSLEDIRRLEARVMKVGNNQEALDEVYEEVVRVLKNGLEEKKVKCGAKKGQPWFTKDLRQIRKEFHWAELEWLRCVDQVKRREKRQSYVEKRRVYKRAVMRAKVAFEERSCMELEKVVNNPKKWWKLAQKMKVVNRKGDKVDVTKVYDKDRISKQEVKQ